MAVVPWYSTSFSPSRQEGLGTATLEQEHVLDGTVFVCRATAEGREDTAVTRVSVEQATTPAVQTLEYFRPPRPPDWKPTEFHLRLHLLIGSPKAPVAGK